MAFTSVRPMRPPAPATISRMSGIVFLRLRAGISARLRAVIALDDHDVAGRMRRTQSDRRLIFGRVVAGKRGRVVLELEHHVARAARALGIFRLTAAYEKFRAVFAERQRIGGYIGLV